MLLLVPNYAEGFRLGQVYLPVSLCHRRSQRRYGVCVSVCVCLDIVDLNINVLVENDKILNNRFTKNNSQTFIKL